MTRPHPPRPPRCAGDRFIGVKVRELTAAQSASQLPELLLHALLAHLAASPAKFAPEYAALCAADPRLTSAARPVDGAPSGSAAAALHQRQTYPGEGAVMADPSKDRSLASLMEELGYEATSSASAVQSLLTKVRWSQSPDLQIQCMHSIAT